MPFVTLTHPSAQNGKLYYEDQGQGRPVVLIHGWPLSGKSWGEQIEPLVAAGFRVITYDRRGFGASCRPWDGYNYDAMAQDLNDLLQALNLHEVSLVGFSMGGGEVVRYLSTYGHERVLRAVLAAAVPPYLLKTQDNPDGALTEAQVHEMQAEFSKDRQAFLDDFTHKFFTPKGGQLAVSEEQRLAAKAIAMTALPKACVDCIAAFANTDFRADLPQVEVPVLVLHGDSDQTVPLQASGQRAHAMLPNSQLQVIEGAPHGLNVSHAQAFNAALIGFFQS